MRINKKFALIFYIILITIPTIILNFGNHFMGNYATVSNLKVSITFLILWFLLSVYCGLKNEKSYKKFTLIYWGISIITSLLIWIGSTINFNGIILIPLVIWYGNPIYGLRYLANDSPSMFNLISLYIGFLLNFLGYFIGYCIYKFRIKND